ncbi:MAG: hypothetical protein BWY82_01871 [Verrucomicrobia bacterium ADurb.Bin474]|nr:MAG: hypothetical protein BWY82_01871 [Verrucomicrobia bacterium ADurb.Bin474]
MKVILKCLAEDKARLGLRTIIGIHQKQHPVHHLHDAFDFGSEVSVTGGVDNVDDVFAPMDRSVFGFDRNALLALKIHRVHGPFGYDLV